MKQPNPASLRPTFRGRPSVEQSVQLTNALLDTSFKLFLEVGYERTSVDTIIGLLNISKKTFYSRFSGKEALFEAVISRFAKSYLEMIVPGIEPGTGIKETLLLTARALLESMLTADVIAICRMIISSHAKFPMLLLHIEETLSKPVHQIVYNTLKKAVEDDQLRLSDIEQATEIFLHGAILARFWQACFGRNGLTLEEGDMRALGAYVDFYLRGISA